CGCGNDYVAVTPDGDIYPCHQFIDHEEFKMGNLSDGKLDMNIKNYFINTHVYSKPDCIKCWAKFYCSGGCNANNYVYADDVHNPFRLTCEIQKKRLECAIMLKVHKAVGKSS
ncbi:MAG: SPASM domain-containing protein, partial [Oscillospiraceae bacterium]